MNTYANQLVFGGDDTPGIVAVESIGNGCVRLFFREDGRTSSVEDSFTPYIWITDPDLLSESGLDTEIRVLRGGGVFNHLALFKTWKDLEQAAKYLRKTSGKSSSAVDAPYFFINNPVQQYLMLSGRTLFKGMAFSDLKRLQVDIETHTEDGFDFCNASRAGDRIIAIALADQDGWTEVLSGAEMDEPDLLRALFKIICERDPDVIEGHNIFRFDFPYILQRAKMHKIVPALGRDGSRPRIRASRFSSGGRDINYPRVDIHGRHVADTYFMVQAYDVAHRSLDSFGLKQVAIHFGIAASDRTYVDGSEISRIFDSDPARIIAYARDDIIETRALSDILSQLYFAQAPILPFSYQNICVRGTAARIDALMLRAYLAEHRAIPRPDAQQNIAGGYTDIFFTGVAENVHHADVRSLYPSLMLKDKLAPSSDEAGAFLQLLDFFRTLRLDAKQRSNETQGSEHVHWDATNTAFKILINSFYGYLAYRWARFSDFDAAAAVTATGRGLLENIVSWIQDNGGKPIEIDTDGVYFVPPLTADAGEMDDFRQGLQNSLPTGIDLEFDGEYRSMFSYKMKNYALLENDGQMIIKGAALKSRGIEPFLRDFLRELLRLKLEQREEELPALYERYCADIETHAWHIRKLAKTETLRDHPDKYAAKIANSRRGRNAAYELALKSDREYARMRVWFPNGLPLIGTRISHTILPSSPLYIESFNPLKALYLIEFDSLPIWL